MSNPGNNETSNPAIPTAAQLEETRLKQWHQQGEALLTIENLRGWINAAGLVLFAPRPQIASPAPSLVEAMLGAPNPNPTLEQIAEARGLVGRLVAEGLAVPLNLLGPGVGTVHAAAPGDTPDFVASTAVFSYVFTLRGDKGWKQPPASTGALKVSNLALAIHEALSRRGALSAYDLSTEVGKEVTEAAVLRALGELWTHLRVLPLDQPDGGAALWELVSARFTKQIKAGANAGQPSALSALISLYLGQAVVAAEEEIESFLSPLASRSRIRDVIHALLSARQLDTVAVEGRTMLHVAGALPAFLAAEPGAAAADVQAVSAGEDAIEAAGMDMASEAEASGEAAPRIGKFIPVPRKVGTGYLAKAKRAKFVAKPLGAAKPGGFERSTKPEFKARPKAGFKAGYKSAGSSEAAPDRERRPFRKSASGGFDKPWEEGKPRRPATGRSSAESSTGRPPRRDFAPRVEGSGRDARPPRKTFSKPGTFGRKREGFAPQASSDERPARREFSPRPGQGSDRRVGPRSDRGERAGFGGPRTAGSYAPRTRRDQPEGGRDGSIAPRKPYAPRGAGFFSAKPRPSDNRAERTASGPQERSDRRENAEGGKKVYRKFDAPPERAARPYSSDRPARTGGASGDARKPAGDFAPRRTAAKPFGKPGGFAGKTGGKPSGGFGKKSFAGYGFKSGSGPGSKPGGKFGAKSGPKSPKAGAPFAGKPNSTFAKFVGNKKPFGKRPPGRKFKPSQGESA